jgi:hypothetical protein
MDRGRTPRRATAVDLRALGDHAPAPQFFRDDRIAYRFAAIHVRNFSPNPDLSPISDELALAVRLGFRSVDRNFSILASQSRQRNSCRFGF